MFCSDSFLPVGRSTGSDSEVSSFKDLFEDLSPKLRRAARDAYRRGWNQYREAGCPFGPEDRAMLVWFLFSSRDRRNATVENALPSPDERTDPEGGDS